MTERRIGNGVLKAPFPYFGGKSKIAPLVWHYLGDVKQYIEPFCGSAAVLLNRPPTKHEICYEIINDLDGMITNVWRAIRFAPDEVAKWCDWPVSHVDLNARRKVLLREYDNLVEKLIADAEFYDAKLAGYYCWCASSWIGAGLTLPNAIPHLAGDKGVHCQRPHLTRNRGVHSKIPQLTCNPGVQNAGRIYDWMNALSNRLRNVKSICGDWKRVCGGNWQDNNKPVGIFFDPPYATPTRCQTIYRHDSATVGKDVEAWCLQRGANPNYRIVVCGYDDEYLSLPPAGWRVEAWKAQGGYAHLGNVQGKINRHRERMFLSPFCLQNAEDKLPLWKS